MIALIEKLLYSVLILLLGGAENDSSVEIYLYSKANSATEWLIPVRHGQHSLIDRNKDVVIFIHGFTEYSHYPYFFDLYEALYEKDVNVISVDWRKLAAGPNYVAARRNIVVVAQCLANYIQQLDLDVSRMHIIGFSLGAHTAGLVGKLLKEQGKQLPRITGLDPAGPLFGLLTLIDEKDRLAPNDARFVTTLHTNRGLFGTAFDVGDVNFYANDGFSQPGCFNDRDLFLICYHRRAVYFYTESVKNGGIMTDRIAGLSLLLTPVRRNRADNLVLGMNISESARGKFYFETNGEKPFTPKRI